MIRILKKSATVVIVLAHSLSCVGLAEATAVEPKNEYLDMDISQLMKITVTSVSKKPQTVADAAAAVFVISQEDIRRSGATTIADALAMAPGLQVARISSSKWSISSRGFAGYASNKLLVLIDGRSVYSPAYSGTFWDMQSTLLEDIERIEVIRGPGATLWGANAVNGVINIITKKAEETQGGLIRAGVGNQEKVMGGARWGGKINDSTFSRLYLTYDERASNTLKEGGGDGHDGWKPAQTGFRIDGEPAGNKQWTLQGDVFKNDQDQTFYPIWTATPPYLKSAALETEVEGANLLGRWRQELSQGDVITVQGYYDYNKRDESYFQQEFMTGDLDVQYETKMGEKQNLTMGAGYRSVNGSFDKTTQVVLPERNDSLYSAFLQDEIGITDSLWLTLGTKYEHNDHTGSEWQPSIKVLSKVKENQSVWASVARAVRTPALADRYGRILIGILPSEQGVKEITFSGDSQFGSETVIAYEMGYRVQASNSLSIDFSVFYNDYRELYTIKPRPSLSGYDLVFINGVDGESYGGEAVVDWKATSWLSFVLTYSRLEMDLRTTEPGGLDLAADYVEQASPVNQASLRSAVDLAKDWQFNLWVRYVDGITARNSANLLGSEVDIERYVVVDANIIWKPSKNVEIMLAGQNLADDRQLQYAMEYMTPQTEIERSVYAKITWRF